MRAADIVLWLGDDAPPSPDMIRIHARADVEGREVAPRRAGCRDLRGAAARGMASLWELLRARATSLLPREDSVAMNQRQRSLIAACAAAARSAAAQEDLILVAEDLRLAMAALDALVGRSDVEAMLDALFRRFCLGK